MDSATREVKERLHLAEVIGEYVQLKQVGPHFKGLCPFHQEKTPSFVVSPDKGIWHCFGCGEGGDVFSFTQKIEGLDFPSALKLLADRAGVELPVYRPAAAAGSSSRARLLELLELAARVYHDILLKQKAGKKAMEYLSARGVTPETLATFAVGYAPQTWHTVQTYLQKKGYTETELIEAGMAIRTREGKLYDRFRGRIMFPIHDTQGRVVAFGGRIVPWHATGEEGKYVNSPETSIYEKRATVYNLHRAKQAIRASGHAVVVEGYMDVVLLVQHGVENVVASSGTAFTPEHIAQLRRFTQELHFAFDGDAAGLKAAISATATAQAAGLRVATVLFSGGQDPADVAHDNPDALATILAHPRSLLSVLLEQLKAVNSGASKETLLQEALPLIRQAAANPIQQGEMIQELSAVLHVPETLLFQRVQEAPRPLVTPEVSVSRSPADATSPLVTPEHRLVGLLLSDLSTRKMLWPELQLPYFVVTSVRDLVEELQGLAAAHSDFFEWPVEKVLREIHKDRMSLAEACRLVAEAEGATSSLTAVHEGQHLLRFMRRRYLEAELKILQQRLAEETVDDHDDLLQKFQAVAEQLAHLKT